MITVKIDYDKVDTSRLFKGQKGRYLNLVLIETPGGQYGDYMVKQETSKEERLAKVNLPILGNGKNLGGVPQGSHMRSPAGTHRPPPRTNLPPVEDTPDF